MYFEATSGTNKLASIIELIGKENRKLFKEM